MLIGSNFRLSGAVPRISDIMADIFDSIFKRITFVESEADSIFEKNFTDAFKVNEDFSRLLQKRILSSIMVRPPETRWVLLR